MATNSHAGSQAEWGRARSSQRRREGGRQQEQGSQPGHPSTSNWEHGGMEHLMIWMCKRGCSQGQSRAKGERLGHATKEPSYHWDVPTDRVGCVKGENNCSST